MCACHIITYPGDSACKQCPYIYHVECYPAHLVCAHIYLSRCAYLGPPKYFCGPPKIMINSGLKSKVEYKSLTCQNS